VEGVRVKVKVRVTRLRRVSERLFLNGAEAKSEGDGKVVGERQAP
jgi:hypothetical protein